MNYEEQIKSAEQEIEQQIMERTAKIEALQDEIDKLQAQKVEVRKRITAEREDNKLKEAVKFLQTHLPKFVADTSAKQLAAQVLYSLLNNHNKPKLFNKPKLNVQVREYEFAYEIWYAGCPESKTKALKEPKEKNYEYYESYNFLGGARPSNIIPVLDSLEYYSAAAYGWLVVYNREDLDNAIFRLVLTASKKL